VLPISGEMTDHVTFHHLSENGPLARDLAKFVVSLGTVKVFAATGSGVQDNGTATSGAVIPILNKNAFASGVWESAAQPVLLSEGRVVVVLCDGLTAGELPVEVRRRGLVTLRCRGGAVELLEPLAHALGLDTRTSAFISYSSRDLDFVKTLDKELARAGHRTWIDRRGISPSEEWQKLVWRGIETSENFVFVITAASVASANCQNELSWAVNKGKRILPVLREPLPDTAIPPALADRQRISMLAQEDFPAAVGALAKALKTDPDYVRGHTWILGRAVAWSGKRLDHSLLLRGSELVEAEGWLVEASKRKEPLPTELHIRFVAASRAHRRKVKFRNGPKVLLAAKTYANDPLKPALTVGFCTFEG
jgi:hypothetical protein